MKKKTKNRNFIVYLLFWLALLFVGFSVFSMLYSEKPLQVSEFDVSFEVSPNEVPGFDLNTTMLSFGRTFPGGNGIIRFVNITNSYDFPIEARVFLTKNIVNAFDVNSSFFIAQGEVFSIPVHLKVPRDFKYGNYTGKIRIELYKFKQGFL